MPSPIDSKSTETALTLTRELIAKAKRLGADAADAVLADGTSLDVAWRNGKIESLEQAESVNVGLRVLIGKRQACIATTDLRPQALETTLDRVLSMAKLAPEDPYCGIADPEQLARAWPDLDLADSYEAATADVLIDQARRAEEAALAVPKITQCESTNASASQALFILMTSNGFEGHKRRTSYSVSASALAGEGTEMETDYDYAHTVYQSDLPTPESIGKSAAERTVSSLGAKKMPTCQVPVVFSPRVSNTLLSHFASAVSGTNIARGTSFLKDKLHQAVFSPTLVIVDDPLRKRGLLSRPFDGEGILTETRNVVEQGVLTTWFLDLASARQLGMKTTGSASRDPDSPPSPSPSNLYMQAGTATPEALIQPIQQGFYVTQLMGMGVNGVTGDYSRAARGFWIDHGQIAFPVNELTIAGNLKDMFASLTPANDLVFRYGYNAPTVLIEKMTVAGA